jgi:ATP-binding cassette, subfamily C (CFTR/MRP), member 1
LNLQARLSQRVRDQYENKEDQSAAPTTTNRLIVLTFSSLGRLLAGPVVARLAVTAFSFTQPFLANAALTYLQSETDPDHPISSNYGYGLIGATALTYVGIAAATSWYWHQAYRCAVMIRGGLADVVFDKLMKLPESDEIESKATTLMVNDVERIMRACTRGHEVWAGTIETGLAAWLLYRQLGPSCLVMLGVAASER